MKRMMMKLVVTYFLLLLLMLIWKPLFMLFYYDMYEHCSLSDWWNVIVNGLPLDESMAGYLSAIPALLLVVNQWWQGKALRIIESCYYVFVSIVIAIVMCLDVALYGYWGTKLDVTPLFYFVSSPESAMASVSTGYMIVALLIMVAVAIVNFMVLRLVVYRYKVKCSKSVMATCLMLLLTAALFIPIRGGFTVSTMNLSAVYFSQDQKLNHAAINPMFSFMYSATHQSSFSDQFRFYDDATAENLFSEMTDRQPSDSIPHIFTTSRPDVYLIIMESFSSHLMSALNGRAPVAVNMDSIANEGILFTNCYANGYRTDRALPAVLSAYPSQPTTSIMKYVAKTDNLPSIPRTFKNQGYNMTYYYGGDANFTNMYAFLVSSGFDRIVSDKDFPISERLSKWGAHDHVVFEKCINDIKSYNDKTPALRVIQTSSSHEPFEVPYSNPAHDDIRANAFAYTDSCMGDFVRQLKSLDKWNNSLLIIVPDHYGSYPQDLENPVERHRIPLIFAGGVIASDAPRRVSTIASQVDIAATLFYQLGIDYDQFTFSKNILNESSPHYAFFVDQSQFGIVTDKGSAVYNCDAQAVVYHQGDTTCLQYGKAFLQKLYDDLDKR